MKHLRIMMLKAFIITITLGISLPMLGQNNSVTIGGFSYVLDSSKKTAKVSVFQHSANLRIPNTVVYNNVTYKITSIANRAFFGRIGLTLTSVTIPNSVTSIGESAFEGCERLTSLTIPNSVTSIGNNAFWGCSGLTSMTIPNSVTSISDNAFCGCSGLKSVTIPNSVTSIGYSAFGGCSGLTSVTIPNSVTSISDNAFDGCSGLKSATIPNSVTSIGWRAFNECSSLTSITIPNSVKDIEVPLFSGCNKLVTIHCLCTNPPNITTYDENYNLYGAGDDVIIENPEELTFPTLYVPRGSIEAYRKAKGWKEFKRIVEEDSENDEDNENDEIFEVAEQNPSFPGGEKAQADWIRQNLRYPQSAKEKNIQARVLVQVVVNKDGSIVEPKVLRSVNPDLDKEAIRLISSMPKWIPGKSGGKEIRVRHMIPITFRLN